MHQIIKNNMVRPYLKDLQYAKFSAYGFLKNLKLFEPFLVLFLLDKGLSFTLIGALYAYREIMTNILEVPTGVIADALGRRRSMVQSFLAYIISFLIFYGAASFWVLMLGMTFFAFGEAFRGGTHKAMIFEYLKTRGWADQKVDYYGHTRAWSQRGSAISALIAAGIVYLTGRYAIVFLISTLPYLLNLCLMLSYPRELDGDIHRYGNIRESFRAVIQTFRMSFRGAGVMRATTNVTIYDGFYNAVKDFLQPMLKTLAIALPFLVTLPEKKRSALLVGLVYFVIYLLSAQASKRSGAFAGHFSHLARPLNITMLTGFGLGALSGLCFVSGLHSAAIVLFTGIFVVQNLRSPLSVSYVSDTVPCEVLASSLSVRSLITAVYTGIFAFITGILADTFGLGQAFIILGAGLILGSPLYLLHKGPPRQACPDPWKNNSSRRRI